MPESLLDTTAPCFVARRIFFFFISSSASYVLYRSLKCAREVEKPGTGTTGTLATYAIFCRWKGERATWRKTQIPTTRGTIRVLYCSTCWSKHLDTCCLEYHSSTQEKTERRRREVGVKRSAMEGGISCSLPSSQAVIPRTFSNHKLQSINRTQYDNSHCPEHPKM